MPTRHESLLFPSRRQETQNYSPLAQFSSLTLKEHEETLLRLNKHKEVIVKACARLAEEEADATRHHHQAMAEMSADEADCMDRLAAAKRMIDTLYLKESENRSESSEKMQQVLRDRQQLSEEEEDLLTMEAQLKDREAHFLVELEEAKKKKHNATLEMEAGISLLERTRQASRMAATNVSRFGAGAASTSVLTKELPSDFSPTKRNGTNSTYYHTAAARGGSPYRPSGGAAAAAMSSSYVSRSPMRMAASPHRSPTRAAVTPPRSASRVQDYAPYSRAVTSPTRAGNTTVSSSMRQARSGGLSPEKQTQLRESVREKSERSFTTTPQIPSGSFLHSVRPSPPRVRDASPSAILNGSRSYTSPNSKLNSSVTAAGGDGGGASSPVRGAFSSTISTAPPDSRDGMANGALVRPRSVGGRSPLHVACASTYRNVDELLELLRAEPDSVNSLDDAGNTPLHCATSAGEPSLEVVHALLLAGVSTTVKNADGFTAFHLACLNTADRQHKLKKFLIFKAAQNPNQRTASGMTVAHLCAAHDRHFDALRYLASVGVDFKITAVLPSSDPGQAARRTSPLEVARNAGRCASKCRAFLEAQEHTQ